MWQWGEGGGHGEGGEGGGHHHRDKRPSAQLNPHLHPMQPMLPPQAMKSSGGPKRIRPATAALLEQASGHPSCTAGVEEENMGMRSDTGKQRRCRNAGGFARETTCLSHSCWMQPSKNALVCFFRSSRFFSSSMTNFCGGRLTQTRGQHAQRSPGETALQLASGGYRRARSLTALWG